MSKPAPKQSSDTHHRKLRASCDGCYLTKIKCNKARPMCSRCLTYGIECVYSPSSRSGRARKNLESDASSSSLQVSKHMSDETRRDPQPLLCHTASASLAGSDSSCKYHPTMSQSDPGQTFNQYALFEGNAAPYEEAIVPAGSAWDDSESPLWWADADIPGSKHENSLPDAAQHLLLLPFTSAEFVSSSIQVPWDGPLNLMPYDVPGLQGTPSHSHSHSYSPATSVRAAAAAASPYCNCWANPLWDLHTFHVHDHSRADLCPGY